MLRKSDSSRNFSRAFVFIPLAVALIFAFACSEPGNDEVQQEEKQQKEAKKSGSSEAEDQVFLAVEDMPEFQGEGVAYFRNYVQSEVTYPEQAAEKGFEGTSFVTFIVNKEGNVEEVEVVRSAHPVLDQAAVEAIQGSPQWEPGKQRGQNVKVKFTIPIVFKLSDWPPYVLKAENYLIQVASSGLDFSMVQTTLLSYCYLSSLKVSEYHALLPYFQ